jgi:hypothetical protein
MIMKKYLVLFILVLSHFAALEADPAVLSSSDVDDVIKELQYGEQVMRQLRTKWDEFSTDLRKPEPVQTSNERAERLRQIGETHWSDADNSFRRLSILLRTRTTFSPGARIKPIANLEELRQIVLKMVGDDQVSRINSYMVRFKAALDENSGGLIVGSSGTWGAERTAWEERYLDPIDSYLYHLTDSLSRVRLATATWPDIAVSHIIGDGLVDRLTAGLYRSPETGSFCKIELRHSSPGESGSWLYVRSVSDQSTTRCHSISGNWVIFNCDSFGNGACRGAPFPTSRTQECRIYRPALERPGFELYCDSWDRSYSYSK